MRGGERHVVPDGELKHGSPPTCDVTGGLKSDFDDVVEHCAVKVNGNKDVQC